MNIQAVLVPVIVCPPHGFAHRVISNDMAAVFGQLLQQSALGGRQGLGGAIRQADQSIGQLLFEGPLAELQRHSRGNVVLRLLAPDRGAAVLRRYGLTPQPADNGCLLPTMEDARLAALVQDLAAEGAGVVGVERQTKNLEEIFLSLTNTQTGKEVG